MWWQAGGGAHVDRAKQNPVRFGVLKGKVQVSADFDEALPDEVLAGFEER